MSDPLPTLWHLHISHYSEKARWALSYKGVEHQRKSPAVPGTHIPVAIWLTRGAEKTLPVLVLDGKAIGDSTAIVATLEERYPDPALYPTDPEQRRRVLELEEFFDEELGPYTRLLAFHELGKDHERFRAVVERAVPPSMARIGGAATIYARTYTALRFGVRDEAAAERARGKILVAFDRVEAELASSGSEYLVGDSFTVADLTAASMLYPLVLPEEGPLPADEPPEGLERFLAPLRDRRGYKWVSETFRRHRKQRPSAPMSATP